MSGWHTRFKERLALGGEPVFVLDFQSPDLFGSDYLSEFRYTLYSHSAPDVRGHIPDAIRRVSGAGQRVNVRSWTSSMGGIRVELASTDVAQFVAMTIPRGSVAELRIGFEGFTLDQYETCGVYSFRGLSGSRNNWTMDLVDAFTLMQTPDKVALSAQFYKEAGATTKEVTGSTWHVGDATLEVSGATTTDFPRDTSSGARGLLYCQPVHDGNDPFYLKFTGLTGNDFDIANSNVIGTTRANLHATDPVTIIGYVHDSPPDVAQMLLFGGLAGASTMPTNWHMNLNYSSHLVNRSDFNSWRSRWLAFYTDFNGDFIVSEPIENAYRALEEYLSAFGSWLVFKEGGLSWRFVQDMERADIAEYVITDADIVSEDGYQLHNQDAPVEFFQVRYPSATNDDGGKVSTRPGQFRYDHPSRSRVYNDDVVTTNTTNAFLNMKERLTPWYTRIPDQLSLTLKGWRYAELCPGDVVSIESNYLYDMINGFDFISYTEGGMDRHHRGTQYMVTGVDVNWSGFSVSVQLSTFPNHT